MHGYSWDVYTGELNDTTILNPASGAGAGAMISDVSDLKRWAEAVCTGTLLEPESHKARLRTLYGYGEGIVKMGSFCGHGGELLGFNSAM